MASRGVSSEQTIPEKLRRMVPIAVPREQRHLFGHLHEILHETALAHVAHAMEKARARPHPRGCVLLGPNGEKIELPEAAFYVLERVAEVLARGDAITLVPTHKELTTQQAANFLNVSRQYLVRLLNANEIPYTKTGKHRRLRFEDVAAFKKKKERERRAKLKELASLTEEFGGYPELE
ncbi:excisionase family DNA-binding protein [Pendulispora brunnea]|uniref:Excisionase family DNA-binding protein n=1 Tax=Pendulispora brunnea TaxID=2905690 RepID=A0ABZ2K4L1_9BACT